MGSIPKASQKLIKNSSKFFKKKWNFFSTSRRIFHHEPRNFSPGADKFFNASREIFHQKPRKNRPKRNPGLTEMTVWFRLCNHGCTVEITVLPCWPGFFLGVSILRPAFGKKSEAFDPKPATASTKSREIFGGFWRNLRKNFEKKWWIWRHF